MNHDNGFGKDAAVARMIRGKARGLHRMASFRIYDVGDLVGELWVHWLEQRDKYDPSIGSYEAYAEHILSNKVRSMIRHRRAEKRCIEREECSLQSCAEDTDGRTVTRGDLIEDRRARNANHYVLRLDLERLTSRLSANDHGVLLARRDGLSYNRISHKVNISRRQVGNALARAGQLGQALKLDTYFENERAGCQRDCVDNK